MSKILLEKWNDVITAEGNKLKPVQEAEAMAQILENQEEYVLQEEQNNTGDMAPFFPILVPAVRRVFPGLLANDLVGVQPLNGPTGYAYAIRFRYGDGAEADARPYPAPFDQSGLNRGDSANPFGFKSWAIVLEEVPGVAPSLYAVGDAVQFDGSGTDDAVVVYAEPGRVLVDLADPVTALPKSGGTVIIDGNAAENVSLALGNEAGFNIIFKDYASKMTTQAGEALGTAGTYDERANAMKTMKMSLERVAAEAQTRKLKAEYSMELAQDLKAVHGLNAEQELINIIEYEVGAEIDRELVDKMNAIATAGLNPWVYGLTSSSIAPGTNVSDGRWEAEKFRTLYTRIVKEANTIALTTRRGAGNFVICSTNVATALESLSSFMYSAVPGTVSAGTGVSKVGVLDGRFTVYVDTFAMIDYITVGYKGPGAFDTGLVYCPYVPLMVQKVVDPNSFQPKIGFMTRYAMIENLFGASNYYRRFFADFSGSSIAGSSLY